MCGIFCEIIQSGSQGTEKIKILQRIKNRGPDSAKDVIITRSDDFSLFFYGAVLWMQGLKLAEQPVQNKTGILLYNGDIFDRSWDCSKSDTQIIMEKLTDRPLLNKSTRSHIIEVLKILKGPFSLIYYDKVAHELYFTRDRIGRSSLLFHRTERNIIISSVLERSIKCSEIPATSIHILNLGTNFITTHNWKDENSEEFDLDVWLKRLEDKQALPDEEHKCALGDIIVNDDQDDVVKYIEETAKELKGNNAKIMQHLLQNEVIYKTVEKIIELLEKSVRIRLERQPKRCKNCLMKTSCEHSTVGILFSGGLDCTILALLADKHVDKEQPIELINVAFKKDDSASYDVPDRVTGRQSFEELKKLCSSRKWVFRDVNVPLRELQESQSNTIADLVHPRQTILDESLGSALWFAARGTSEDGTSPCRVLLVGSGADELFGGYTRHRNAFKRQSWPGLRKELALDWSRISFRNLARDNRVICDHGRQPRMPYLDEDFAGYVLQLKPWLKCFPSEYLGPGLGDKLALRLVAYELGLREAMSFPKRALQFGSRIANKKEKGCDISKNFLL